ncbi:fumarylacetoacetate hydrolase family protein [Variovorax ginsengisoli]|uniref:2-keto-4-pentenoate hydratase/2-oxohepta-3-ene-1,7-dioic acid hydratase in catechol pathway n=1 Tax=Variovorax ginsengisoli TaxID=363844 RepID=A0ABT9SC77_9BURK|nr:fumarylacetoacetate hydrolase family protein [Variovorax ginsengisoli]MDP9901941.1 2-keto-4-pentenoate hydratase/2-oxohepta-3-ene-1,7-dioic acid hydratase in catechol pathway [Variovorax ginsengisoli]
MKLLSFEVQGSQRFGAWVEGGVVDLTYRLGDKFPDLLSVLQAGALQEIAVAVEGAKADFSAEQITFLPVIPKPPKIICIGINYEEHRSETEREPTLKPPVFGRFSNSQVGHLGVIALPPESEKLDYEGEIAVIIGKAGRRIPADQVWKHVAGYAPYNDASVRDWQGHTQQWTPGKNFWHTGGFGPWMSTADEFGDDPELHLSTRLNGVEVQRATSRQMIFSIAELITYCSTFTALEPGDVIVTGTPGGVGVRRKPQLFMKHGDVVEVEISEIGVLRNVVEREA